MSSRKVIFIALIANLVSLAACSSQRSFWSQYPLRPAVPQGFAKDSSAPTPQAIQWPAVHAPNVQPAPESLVIANPQPTTAKQQTAQTVQPDAHQLAMAAPSMSLPPEAAHASAILPGMETTPAESLVPESPTVPMDSVELASATAANSSALAATNLASTTAASTAAMKSDAPQSQPAARLVISGVRPGRGNVKVAIFTDASSFPQPTSAIQTLELAAANTTLETTLPSLAQFAIAVYQDINADGELNRNRLGVPVEPFAFSNNAMGNRGPPSFDQAAIIQPAPNEVGRQAFIVPIQLP
ncbi:MAG: DUF2141 domain-containing protein [Pirellulaceae bacterium]|nr:DUF2141 domain-containing protein [Pirellulaceae bacterium]